MSDDDEARQQWIVLSFTAPAEPSALRVFAWRTLKQVGATSIGSGAYAVPDRPELRTTLSQLSDRVVAGGGTAFILVAHGLDAAHEAALLRRVTAMRNEEYAQVAKSTRHFIEHVDRETATEDFRFAEVESLEEELEKVRRQLLRVIERDYFTTPCQEHARSAVLAAERRMAAYVEAAYEREQRSETGHTGGVT